MFPEAIREIAAFLAARALRLWRRVLPSEASLRLLRRDSPGEKLPEWRRKVIRVSGSVLSRRAAAIAALFASRAVTG
jgi:hypothetical protein